MTNRRVGYNELSAIEACKAYVAAQDEYFRLDRDGNGLREYARRFISTPGTHDGLYWPPENQADISPLDGFAEDANLAARSGEKPEPYDGYYFRILTAQGPAAPGGAFSYLINGHMIAGHAMVAWPAAYGDRASRRSFAARTASSTKRTSGRTLPLSEPRWPNTIPTRPGRSSSSGGTNRVRAADGSDVGNSWASFRERLKGREPKAGEAANLTPIKFVRPGQMRVGASSMHRDATIPALSLRLEDKMKSISHFLRITVLGGVLFLTPIVVLVFILSKAFDFARRALKPVTAVIPDRFVSGRQRKRFWR